MLFLFEHGTIVGVDSKETKEAAIKCLKCFDAETTKPWYKKTDFEANKIAQLKDGTGIWITMFNGFGNITVMSLGQEADVTSAVIGQRAHEQAAADAKSLCVQAYLALPLVGDESS